MRSLQQFWSVRRIGEDKVTLARLGPLRLWLARAEKEWGVAFHQGEDVELMDYAQVPEDVVPENLQWNHYLFRQAPRDFQFEASTPGLPVSFRMDGVINIPNGETGDIHLLVPVWIKICVISESGTHYLREIPSEPLRKSWFGKPMTGHMSYSNPNLMQLESEVLQSRPNHIVYEISINNTSGEMLSFDKFCLNLENTGLYSGMNHLWGSKIKLDYLGAEKDCQVEIDSSAPAKESGISEVKPANAGISRVLGLATICCCQSS